MTDPWQNVAARIKDWCLTQAAQAKRDEIAAHAAEDAATKTRHREIENAIDEAIPKLTEFLRQRGAAAQELLAAHYERVCLPFGQTYERKSYWSVHISGRGLCQEIGTAGEYRNIPAIVTPATPRQAVEAFAYFGKGYHKPEHVRGIVSWLSDQLDTYAQLWS